MRIRKLKTTREYMEAERLQRDVWHFPDRELIPLNELVVFQKHGGHVFGAFDRGRMMGLCYGSPGYRDGKTYHYSRMLGVVSRRQNSGLGLRLKLRQREYVLDQGLDLIRWTFDPLQSRNAHFNLEKLGCLIREYAVNLYPGSLSRFNRGIDPDRFIVEWWIASKRVKRLLRGRAPARDPATHAPALVMDAKRRPAAAKPRIRARRVSVEIPEDIDALRAKRLELARAWRRETRRVFLSLMRRGYVVCGFERFEKEGRGVYLLEKGYRV